MDLSGGAAADLGLGDMLSQQVRDDTDEERKKRMRQMQQGAGAVSASLLGDRFDAGY